MPTDLQPFLNASASYPPPEGVLLSYGTAGFRTKAELLGSTVFRCGALIALRSAKLGATTGLMITASHNPEQDNGVKLVEPLGEMLVPEWELHATRLARAQTDSELREVLSQLVDEEGITPERGTIYIAYDTRPSSVELAAAARKGAESLGAQVLDLGLRTTPQLHYAVRAANTSADGSEKAYYSDLADGFRQLVSKFEQAPVKLVVDCANGVGAPKLQELNAYLADTGLSFDVRNSGTGTLNGDCGSDHVHVKRALPTEFGSGDVSKRCASVDGDADRVVFFRAESLDKPVTVFDGDKIACLAALFLQEVFSSLPSPEQFRIGVVQTAYANGAATEFVKKTLKLETVVAKTGVKHLHHAAVSFDAGVYFESNGHGTVVFSEKLMAYAKKFPGASGVPEILALSYMINQAVGDAISGILLVECVLRRKSWSMDQWAEMYADLASRQLKVRVADRSSVKTTEDESTCLQPQGLQAAIDRQVAKYPSGRAFVRPSGTEDVVRVYSEAKTQEEADELAVAVARLTFDLAGGVGDPPVEP